MKKAVPLDPPEMTEADFEHTIRRSQRLRIIAGQLEAGDVAALRRFVRLTQEQFAEALGISVAHCRTGNRTVSNQKAPGSRCSGSRLAIGDDPKESGVRRVRSQARSWLSV